MVKKLWRRIFVFSSAIVLNMGFGGAKPAQASAEDWKKRYEAEDAEIHNNVVTETESNDARDFSGRGYVGHFGETDSSVTFTITAPEDGLYDLIVAAIGSYGRKYANVYVNGISQGDIPVEASKTPVEIRMQVYLDAGGNTIKIGPNWTWFNLDYIRIDHLEADLHTLAMDFDRVLSNPDANEDAKRLWSLLIENYGSMIISGQQANELAGPEIPKIKNITGSYPAIMGFDFMDYSSSRVEIWGGDGKSAEHALEWAAEGGIVKFNWHWNVPRKYLINQDDKPTHLEGPKRWWSGFYQSAVDKDAFDLAAIMDGGDPEGLELLIKDIDIVASHLKRFRDMGIPVLWRPLHEASGAWFWWGAYGPEPCRKLWILMFERMTLHHGLHNLIWIWNSEGVEWFPGAEYVDIVSVDYYAPAHDYGSLQTKYYQMVKELHELGTMKMLGLSECAAIPDIDLMIRDKALWGFWVTWVGDYVDATDLEQLQKMYGSPLVYKLDNLPPLYRTAETPETPTAAAEESPSEPPPEDITPAETAMPEPFEKSEIGTGGNLKNIGIVFLAGMAIAALFLTIKTVLNKSKRNVE